MTETAKKTSNNPEPEQDLDNGTEPLLGSGFEDEQPEPDFDERI